MRNRDYSPTQKRLLDESNARIDALAKERGFTKKAPKGETSIRVTSRRAAR